MKKSLFVNPHPHILRLAEWGEGRLGVEIYNSFTRIQNWVNYICEEKLGRTFRQPPGADRDIDINHHLDTYFLVIQELRACGLDTSSYDNRVHRALGNLIGIQAKFLRELGSTSK